MFVYWFDLNLSTISQLNWSTLLWLVKSLVGGLTSSSNGCCWGRLRGKISASMICLSRVLVLLRRFFILMTTALSFNHWLNMLASIRFFSIGHRHVPWNFCSALFKKTFSWCCSSVVKLLREDRRNCYQTVWSLLPIKIFGHLCCCQSPRSLISWVVLGVEAVPLISACEFSFFSNSVSDVHLV